MNNDIWEDERDVDYEKVLQKMLKVELRHPNS
jgi:hypothetical protein